MLTLRFVSLITVVTMKKNKSIKTISGRDAVLIALTDFPPDFLNLDITEYYLVTLGSASEIAMG